MPGPNPSPLRVPSPFGVTLPLAGLTILAVEDSRFASEALRLLCLRSGARLQRTGSLAGAARHFAAYRPDVALIDLGLPDGSGLDLIAGLAGGRAGVVLAMSGDPEGRTAALAAGAAEFFEKPMQGLAGFVDSILVHLARPAAHASVTMGVIAPDRQALRDDLSHAAGLALDGSPAPYVSAFVQSIARTSGDSALEMLARSTPAMGAPGMTRLHRALSDRIDRMPHAFSANPAPV